MCGVSVNLYERIEAFAQFLVEEDGNCLPGRFLGLLPSGPDESLNDGESWTNDFSPMQVFAKQRIQRVGSVVFERSITKPDLQRPSVPGFEFSVTEVSDDVPKMSGSGLFPRPVPEQHLGRQVKLSGDVGDHFRGSFSNRLRDVAEIAKGTQPKRKPEAVAAPAFGLNRSEIGKREVKIPSKVFRLDPFHESVKAQVFFFPLVLFCHDPSLHSTVGFVGLTVPSVSGMPRSRDLSPQMFFGFVQ